MTLARQSDLLNFHTQDTLDETINTLPLSFIDFSFVSGTKGSLYGVKVDSNRSEDTPFLVNECLRKGVIRTLVSVCSEAESKIGYMLSDRYLTYTLPLPNAHRFMLPYPGVEKVEVKRTWVDVATYPVNYYVLENIIPIYENGSYYVEVPIASVSNPDLVYLRNSVDNGTYEVNRQISNYPSKTNDGLKWKIYIHPKSRVYETGETINVQHRDYVVWTVPKPTGLPPNANLHPVYPGTHQWVPQAKPMVDTGTHLIFTLYVWPLVNPEFLEGPVDLYQANAQFYKMFQNLTLAYWVEEDAKIEFVVFDGTDEKVYSYDPLNTTTPHANVNLVNSEVGICNLGLTDALIRQINRDFPETLKYQPNQIFIRLHYKVSPKALSNKLRSQITSVLNAIAEKVAADLPTVDCGCDTDTGFIAVNKRTYGKAYLNPATGVEVYQSEFGTAHGVVSFNRTMNTVYCYTTPVIVGVRFPYDSNVERRVPYIPDYRFMGVK